MTEGDGHVRIRIPTRHIVKETDDWILCDLGDGAAFLEQVLKAAGNPGMAVVRMDEEEAEE